MSKSQTATIEGADALAEARERLSTARAALDAAARQYNERGTAGDGVALREARAAHEKAQTDCAALEDRSVAEKAAADAAARKLAKSKIAKLAERREALAAKTDDLTEQLVGVLQEWLAVDDSLYTEFPGPKNRIPAQLGRSRILGLLRETQNRVGAGLIAHDVAVSQRTGLRKAADVVRDDNRQIAASL